MALVGNIHGRRGGRGLRPWLLIPKVLAAGLYLGALAAATSVWICGQSPALPPRQWTGQILSGVILRVMVPALLLAAVLGLGLLLQMPRVFLRMRWMQLKLLAIAVMVPSGHWFCSSRFARLQQAWAVGRDDPAAAWQLGCGLFAVLIGSMVIIILGRLKPRLGQSPVTPHVA